MRICKNLGALAAVLLLAACPNTNKAPDSEDIGNNGSDRDLAGGGGDDDGGAGSDGAQGAVFSGTSLAIQITDRGDQQRPDDFRQLPVVGLTFGSVAPTTYQATTKADGTFTIPGLPMGPAWIRQGTDRFFHTTARSIDLNHYHLGRLDRVEVMNETTVTMNFSSLSAWGDEDEIHMTVSNLGFFDAPLSYSDKVPTAGSTSVMGATIDWRDIVTPLVIDPARGDQTILAQLSTRSAMGVTYLALTRSASLPALAIKDGMPATINAVFGETAPQAGLPVNWKRSLFEAHLGAVNPMAQGFSQTGSVYANPGGELRGDLAEAPDLLRIELASGATDLNLGTLQFRNPYPSTWTVYGRIQHQYRVPYTVPGVPRNGTLLASIMVSDTVARLGAGPIQPVVSPPTNVTINGMPALTSLNGVGTSPTLRWDPPVVGTANGYIVTLYLLEPVAGQMFPRSSRVATLYTAERGFLVPPGLMTAGKLYCFQIRAVSQPGVDLTRTPFLVPTRRGHADTITALFTP